MLSVDATAVGPYSQDIVEVFAVDGIFHDGAAAGSQHADQFIAQAAAGTVIVGGDG